MLLIQKAKDSQVMFIMILRIVSYMIDTMAKIVDAQPA